MKKKLIMSILCLSMVLTNSFFVMAASDSYEPNNTYGTAVEVPLLKHGVPVKATINGSGDQDWYKTEYYNEGYETLTLTPPAGKNYGIIVHYKNPQGNIVRVAKSINAGPGQAETVRFPVTKNHEYLILVYSPTYEYSTEEYEVRQDNFETTGDAAYEPSDSFAEAFEVDFLKGNVNATISSSSDVDYYKYISDYTGDVRARLFFNPRNYKIIIYDNDRNETVGQGYCYEDIDFKLVEGTEYMVIVHGVTSNDYYSGIPYTIQMYKK